MTLHGKNSPSGNPGETGHGPNPIALSYIVPFYFDQENSRSLLDLLHQYSNYAPALLDRLQFVLVDDGSPTPPSIPPELDLNLTFLRIEEDIPWNQGGARNLGVIYGRSDKILATDVDHQFPETTLRHLIGRANPGRSIYRFRREDPNGNAVHPHPNTLFMSRGRFLGLYGVDEEFSGAYASEDIMFWRWQRYNGTRFRYLNRKFISTTRKLDLDRSYHSLERDTSTNRELFARKRKEWEQWGPIGGHSRKFLAFTWRVVEDRKRSTMTWVPEENRRWKKLWFLRQVFGR